MNQPSLPQQGSRIGPRVYIGFCLGTQIRSECILNSPQMSPRVCSAGWGNPRLGPLFQCHCAQDCQVGSVAMQVLQLGSWSDKLKSVFSNQQVYEFDCLPGCSSRRSSKTSKALSCLKARQPTLQVPRLMRPTGLFFFFLQIIGYTFPSLGSRTTRLQRSCPQTFWSDEGRRQSPCRCGWGYFSTPLPGQW